MARTAARRRGSAALEFAVLLLPFTILLLFSIELAYDLFTQEVMESSLYYAARQIQIGNTQNALNGNDFITKYMAPVMTNMLSAKNVYIRVQRITPKTGQDYYDFTSANLPVVNGSLDLSSFGSGNFCNAGATQWLLISAIYIGPTFIGGLLPNIMSVNYNGSLVHITLSTIGVVSENFPQNAAALGGAAAC